MMIKEDQTNSLRKLLAGLHDDQLIGVSELAVMLNTSTGMIYRLAYVDSSRLPPKITTFGRKLTWRLGTCREWLRSQPEAGGPRSMEVASTKRIGRLGAPGQSTT
jgi:predicted DNA-binding transcriptional regulator AlpA